MSSKVASTRGDGGTSGGGGGDSDGGGGGGESDAAAPAPDAGASDGGDRKANRICTEDRERELEKIMHGICDGTTPGYGDAKCELVAKPKAEDVSKNERRLAIAYECKAARQLVTDECYGGIVGDHATADADVQRRIDRCERFLKRMRYELAKCGGGADASTSD